MPIAMRIDAHDNTDVCNHDPYLRPRLEYTNHRCRSDTGNRSRQVCEESRPQGGQASDQANKRSARPAPALAREQIPKKDTPKAVTQPQSHTHEPNTSLTPHGTRRLSQTAPASRVQPLQKKRGLLSSPQFR